MGKDQGNRRWENCYVSQVDTMPWIGIKDGWTKLAYDAYTLGIGNEETDPVVAIEKSYKKDVTDEFIIPTVIKENNKPLGLVDNNDSIIFFNFQTR